MTTVPARAAYDPFDVEVLRDPYPAYRELRELWPVFHRDGEPEFWALSRFADVWEAVRQPEVFSSADGLTFWPDEIARLGLAPTIVMLDPPRQTQLRALVGRAFTPRRVRDLEDEIRAFVGQRIDAMEQAVARGEDVDLHHDFASPIPTFVLSQLLGVPEADRSLFGPWVTALVRVQDDGFRVNALSSAAQAAVGEMFGYFTELIRRRRTEPATISSPH